MVISQKNNMKLKLTISERIYTLAILNQYKGNLDTLVDVLDDIKEVRVLDEEWTKADKQVNSSTGDDGKPIISWTWNDEKGGEKEIELKTSVKEYLVGKIDEMNAKGEFSLQDKAAITLKEKLNAKGK